jgi:hypothetical protein
LISRHCGVEINATADSEAMQAIKEGKDSQLSMLAADIKTHCKKRGKELHSFCQDTKRDRGASNFERY